MIRRQFLNKKKIGFARGLPTTSHIYLSNWELLLQYRDYSHRLAKVSNNACFTSCVWSRQTDWSFIVLINPVGVKLHPEIRARIECIADLHLI